MSQFTCSTRVRRLERSGIIAGYHAEVDLAAIGRPLEALIAIQYQHAQRRRVENFTEAIFALPETLDLAHVTGADDYLLRVAVADTSTLRRFVLDRLLTRPEIAHVQTAIATNATHATPGSRRSPTGDDRGPDLADRFPGSPPPATMLVLRSGRK